VEDDPFLLRPAIFLRCELFVSEVNDKESTQTSDDDYTVIISTNCCLDNFAIPTAHLLRKSLTNHKPVYLDLVKVLGKKTYSPNGGE